MKINIEFLQTGGVPLTNDLMDTLQSAYQIYNVLGDLAGNFTILSGCEIVGATVLPGIVAINGDVLPFEGGVTSSNVYIKETEVLKTFQDQTDKVLIRKKIVKFGNSTTVYPWADFVKLDTIKGVMQTVATMQAEITTLKLKTAPIENGNLVWAWRKPAADIPAGWKECTEFAGKTLVGRLPGDPDFGILGGSIGSKTHTLTIAEMPSHDHGFTAYLGTQSVVPNTGSGQNGNNQNLTTASKGGGSAHNNIQPSRIVNFIEPDFI